MKKDFFSSQVCEQLARELVTEQAEFLKHEALVKEIKTKLFEGKQQLIKKLVEGKMFHLEGKKMLALCMNFYDESDTMHVVITMGLNPNVSFYSLTRREKLLIKNIRMLYHCCREGLYDNAGLDAKEMTHELSQLKNGITLTRCYSWDIDFSNATTPGFFEQSGLEVRNERGCCMLEDLSIE